MTNQDDKTGTSTSANTAIRALYRYSDMSWEKARRKVEIMGPTEALQWGEDKYKAFSKAVRDPDFNGDDLA